MHMYIHITCTCYIYMYIYIHIYVYKYVYIHMYMCVKWRYIDQRLHHLYMHICVYTHSEKYFNTYIYIHTRVHTYLIDMKMYQRIIFTYDQKNVCVFVKICILIYIHTYSCILSKKDICIDKYLYMCTSRYDCCALSLSMTSPLYT